MSTLGGFHRAIPAFIQNEKTAQRKGEKPEDSAGPSMRFVKSRLFRKRRFLHLRLLVVSSPNWFGFASGSDSWL